MTDWVQTVFVVDDDISFLTSINRLLRGASYAVECFSSAADFLARRSPQAAGCIVADLRMPDMDGLTLQAVLARSDNPLPIVFLSGHGDIPTSVKAMRQGAEDFLVKTAPKEDLIDAIERALARGARERQRRAHRCELRVRFNKLTPRENEVLRQVLLGRLNKQIAFNMGIDERSVKRHRANLMRKLAVKSVAKLAQLAVEAGVSDDTTPSDAP